MWPTGYHYYCEDSGRRTPCQEASQGLRDEPATVKLEWVPLGKGEVRVAEQFQALVADGYEGYVSPETHYRPKRLPEEVLRSPSGEAFSESGAQASYECLARWEEMMR